MRIVPRQRLAERLAPLRERGHVRARRLAAGQPRECPQPAPPRAQAELVRARAAGGPIDRASYVCVCGLLFDAAVSATVACPHCGREQAW